MGCSFGDEGSGGKGVFDVETVGEGLLNGLIVRAIKVVVWDTRQGVRWASILRVSSFDTILFKQ